MVFLIITTWKVWAFDYDVMAEFNIDYIRDAGPSSATLEGV